MAGGLYELEEVFFSLVLYRGCWIDLVPPDQRAARRGGLAQLSAATSGFVRRGLCRCLCRIGTGYSSHAADESPCRGALGTVLGRDSRDRKHVGCRIAGVFCSAVSIRAAARRTL